MPELLGCEPYRPRVRAGCATLPARQVGGRVIGPVPSTPLSIVRNYII
jgi:hypothetical protein